MHSSLTCDGAQEEASASAEQPPPQKKLKISTDDKRFFISRLCCFFNCEQLLHAAIKARAAFKHVSARAAHIQALTRLLPARILLLSRSHQTCVRAADQMPVH
jgi:hypothetical protein